MVNILEKVEDLYDKNFKFEERNVGKIYEVGKFSHTYVELTQKKNDLLSKATYKFNSVPIKIPTQFFIDLQRTILNFM